MPTGYRKGRTELVLDSDILCQYGCGQQAHYRFLNGKACCSSNIGGCPAINNFSKFNPKKGKKLSYEEICNRTYTRFDCGLICKLCKCGCLGGPLPPNRQYLPGHYIRSKEVIEKQRKNLLQYYEEHPETAIQISQSVKEYYKQPENREANSQRIKEKWKDPEFAESVKQGRAKSLEEGEMRNNLSKGQLKRFSDPLEREKQSRRITKAYIEGKLPVCGGGKSGFFFSAKNGRDMHYRSSYELLAYEILEQLSKVECYKNEPFHIPYRFNGIIRNTVPDILVTYTDGTKELIEIKASYAIQNEKTNAKFWAMNDYAVTQGWDFNVWTEKELGLN